jgi:hypothetical protein
MNKSHKGNASHNYIEIPSLLSQHSYHQENKQQEMLVRMWLRGKNPHTLLVGM